MTPKNDNNVGFHYTSLDSLYWIIHNGTLNCGNVLLMNDPEEISNGKDFLKLNLPSFAELGINEQKLVNDINREKFLDTNRSQIHAFSFSKSENDLFQWRQYGDNGSGAYIEFDIKNLKEVIGINVSESIDFKYKKCLYKDKEKKKELGQATEEMRLMLQNKPHDDKDKLASVEVIYKISQRFTDELLSFISVCKNKSYELEKEYRLVFNEKTPLRGIYDVSFVDDDYVLNMYGGSTEFKRNSYGITSYIDIGIVDSKRLQSRDAIKLEIKDFIESKLNNNVDDRSYRILFMDLYDKLISQLKNNNHCGFDERFYHFLNKNELKTFHSKLNKFNELNTYINNHKVINKIVFGPNANKNSIPIVRQLMLKTFGYQCDVSQSELKMR